jgi:hypothetical protein
MDSSICVRTVHNTVCRLMLAVTCCAPYVYGHLMLAVTCCAPYVYGRLMLAVTCCAWSFNACSYLLCALCLLVVIIVVVSC